MIDLAVSRAAAYQGLLDGSEIALRLLIRAQFPAVHALAKRIVEPNAVEDVVVEAFVLVWAEPTRWSSEAVDISLIHLVRAVALAVRRRGLPASRVAQDIEPPWMPIRSDLPVLVSGPECERLRRAISRLPEAQRMAVEGAWWEGARGNDAALDAGLGALAAAWEGTEAYAEDQAVELPLGAFGLGLLSKEEATATLPAVGRDQALRYRLSTWMAVAAAMIYAEPLGDGNGLRGRCEQRIIQRARAIRPPRVRTHRALRAARRAVAPVAIGLLVAVVALFGYLAFRPGDPIDGRALALNEDGTMGVLLPRYETSLFALVFWGLPEAEEHERWQLWLVRASGEVEPGPFLERDETARATVSIDPNRLGTDDRLIGFAVSLDEPGQRVGGEPSSDHILYQFGIR